MAKLRVVAKPQAGKSPVAKSAHLYRQNPVGERVHTNDLPIKRKVDTIFGGACKVGKSHRTRDKYAQEEKYPQVMVHATNACPLGGA